MTFPTLITNHTIESAFEQLLSTTTTPTPTISTTSIATEDGSTVTSTTTTTSSPQPSSSSSSRQTTMSLPKLFAIVTKTINLPDIDPHTFGLIYRQFTTFSSNGSGVTNAVTDDSIKVQGAQFGTGPTTHETKSTPSSAATTGMNFIDWSHWVKEVSEIFI